MRRILIPLQRQNRDPGRVALLYTYKMNLKDRVVLSVYYKRGHENIFSGFDDVAIRSEKNPKSFSELVGEISPFSRFFNCLRPSPSVEH
jgi:hypothetical protein